MIINNKLFRNWTSQMLNYLEIEEVKHFNRTLQSFVMNLHGA